MPLKQGSDERADQTNRSQKARLGRAQAELTILETVEQRARDFGLFSNRQRARRHCALLRWQPRSFLPVADRRPADVEMARVLKTIPLRMANSVAWKAPRSQGVASMSAAAKEQSVS